jgi:hypothetical protein
MSRDAARTVSNGDDRVTTESFSRTVLGLYLHVAHMTVMASFPSEVGRGEIIPNIIGLLEILVQLPGLSQAKFARLIGLERAAVGVMDCFVEQNDGFQVLRSHSWLTPVNNTCDPADA